MSVESLSLALHHSRAVGTAKVVLFGICNHDGDGGAWPSIATLTKYANVSVRNVQKALRSLVELGEIRIEGKAGGLASTPEHERPNLYTVLLACPPDCDGTTNHRVPPAPRPRRRPHHPPVASDTTPPSLATPPPPSLATPEPSSEPSPQPSIERGRRTRPNSALPRPLNPRYQPSVELLTWAATHCPLVDADQQTRWFIDHHTDRRSRSLNWDAKWQDSMKRRQADLASPCTTPSLRTTRTPQPANVVTEPWRAHTDNPFTQTGTGR